MFGDTGALSFQLDMYRWEDHLRRMGEIRQRNAEQSTSDLVIAQYNDLAERYNALADAALEAGRAADASQSQVVTLRAELEAKEREIASLQRKLIEAEDGDELTMRYLDRANASLKEYVARAVAAEAELRELRSQNK